MATQGKIEEVAHLKKKFEQAASLVLADYRGLTADEMVKLREKFTKEGLEFRVVKDTLARIAAEEAGLKDLVDLFTGPIGVAIGYDDPVLAFKLTEECRAAYSPRYTPKGGVFEGVVISQDEIKRYGALPSRAELLAKLAMLLNSPMRSLAMMLKAKIRELVAVLNEARIKREQQNKEE